jgi:uracil-DNA glycosylase
LIDKSKHFVLSWPHPSPFSAYRWFFWCRHFSKTNEILEKLWKEAIVW